MWVVAIQFFWFAVMDDRRLDRVIVRVLHAATREEGEQMGQGCQLLDRVRTVHVAASIMRARDVVEVDGRPESRTFFVPAGGFEQPERVHHHARDVRLAVEGTGVGEKVGCRDEICERQW